ncbi:hypothetical protein GCM10007874_60180 [Labrys miyagiensis]|uniref:OmpR/PhoB-type domain-containing protein n=1 Tax=Labrys miyagiensis TaxID=346912 RepID=A0ABQ6CRM4_9HYPH|nr:transcriptional regulator [Labrys miyagiensis]GLS22998.1 hypothetical protein GCM10007874_60180 [Labrys miyagiensis]
MPANNEPSIRFGEFSLNAEKGRVYRGDVPLALRPKVFALLSYLANNAGRVVSKDELLDAVWPRVTVSEDSLTQVVKELRKSLDDARAILIRTIPRRGYLLDTVTVPIDDAGSQPTVPEATLAARSSSTASQRTF